MQFMPVGDRYRQWRQRPSHRLATGVVLLLGVLVVAFIGYSMTSRSPHRPEATIQEQANTVIALPTASASPCQPAAPRLVRLAQQLRDDPSNVRIAVMGDSTRDDKTAGRFIVRSLRSRLAPAKVISFGRAGFTLTKYRHRLLQQRVRAMQPDLIELSIGIDDLRRGASTGREFRRHLGSYVTRLHSRVPKADIILSVPAALAMHDVDGQHLVRPGTADRVTHELRAAYLTVAGKHRYVVLNDVQQQITSTHADPFQPPRFLADQVNPDAFTGHEIAKLIADDVTC